MMGASNRPATRIVKLDNSQFALEWQNGNEWERFDQEFPKLGDAMAFDRSLVWHEEVG